MVEHMMIAECFPHKCGNLGPNFSSKLFLSIIATSFFKKILFWGLLLGCQNLPGKKNKQTNKQTMWQNSGIVSETEKKSILQFEEPMTA
jgi:hypothetical protein